MKAFHRVAVLLGGRSAEREISLRTGAAVAEALRRLGRDVVEVDAGVDLARHLTEARVEAAFVALHGRWGEDGCVQGLLEVMGIPYTGSGVLASSLAMDKALAKVVFRAQGVPTPDFQVLEAEEGADAVALPCPVVIKPVAEGSTIGVSIARSAMEVGSALTSARAHGKRVLVEAFVEGRELTVGVLEGRALPLVEVIPEKGFYDYEAKYTPGKTRYLCPASVSAEEEDRLSRTGEDAYRSLGCRGAARTDLILGRDGEVWVLEVNTIPGMTPTSLLPKAAAAAGMGFDQLVDRIMRGAMLEL